MRLRLVHTSRANRFMRDILEGIAFEAVRLGVDAEVVDDSFDADASTVHVVIPHEYFAVTPPSEWPDENVLGRTIALTVEHPGTMWFEISAVQAQRCAAIVDINDDARRELRRRGLAVEPFQLGYTPHWDHWGGRDDGREIDILYLASTDERRNRMLADAGRWWSDVTARLHVPEVEPKSTDVADSITGPKKYELLARSQILVNAHRLESTCLEWARVVEAMCNGCVVVSEHSTDAAPLRANEHFVSARLEALGVISRALLDTPEELERLRRSAYQFVTTELTMRPSVERLVTLGSDLARSRRSVAPAWSLPQPPGPPPAEPGWPTSPNHLDIVGASIRRVEQRVKSLERQTQRLRFADREGEVTREVLRTDAYDLTRPRVSVIVALFNHAGEITEALSSIVETDGPSIEVLVHDDASTDGSVDAVSAFFGQRPWVPALVLAGAVNQGPSAVRNEMVAHARGELIFVLDADNGVYPTVLGRLTEALDDDPDAAFAYSTIATRRGGTLTQLVSCRPWLPHLFRSGNYIDTMALIRTDVLRGLGGWSSEVDGWEDFHMWVRMAEQGMHATYVPQVLSWYRVTQHSLTFEVATDHLHLWSKIREAAPTVMHD